MRIDDLEFLPIDLALHGDLCIRIREDSFICSFGTAEKFHEQFGREAIGFLDYLRQRMSDLPGSCVHVWRQGKIIGQIEMRRSREKGDEGYVNLYYLLPECRGAGFGVKLDRFVEAYFRNLAIKGAQLSVSPTNLRAARFYSKCGWTDLGPRENHSEVNLMEKRYA